MKVPFQRLILAAMLSVPACASPPLASSNPPLPAEVLLSSLQCGVSKPAASALWIDNPRNLRQQPAMGFTASFSVTADDILFEIRSALGDRLREALDRVDFASEGVLLISMGKQPSAGFALGFEEGMAQLQGNTLEVKMSWKEPSPGQFFPQILTSPCLLLKLPAVNFRKIRIMDQKYQLRVHTVR
jgi:hypothetical protein